MPKKLVGTSDNNFYNHYSEIATVQANWDLDTLGRWDVGANVFDFVAEKTGDSVRHWSGKTPLSQMYWNASYAGKLNNKNTSVPWPVPGTKLMLLRRLGSLWRRILPTPLPSRFLMAYTPNLSSPVQRKPSGEWLWCKIYVDTTVPKT